MPETERMVPDAGALDATMPGREPFNARERRLFLDADPHILHPNTQLVSMVLCG